MVLAESLDHYYFPHRTNLPGPIHLTVWMMRSALSLGSRPSWGIWQIMEMFCSEFALTAALLDSKILISVNTENVLSSFLMWFFLCHTPLFQKILSRSAHICLSYPAYTKLIQKSTQPYGNAFSWLKTLTPCSRHPSLPFNSNYERGQAWSQTFLVLCSTPLCQCFFLSSAADFKSHWS